MYFRFGNLKLFLIFIKRNLIHSCRVTAFDTPPPLKFSEKVFFKQFKLSHTSTSSPLYFSVKSTGYRNLRNSFSSINIPASFIADFQIRMNSLCTWIQLWNIILIYFSIVCGIHINQQIEQYNSRMLQSPQNKSILTNILWEFSVLRQTWQA